MSDDNIRKCLHALRSAQSDNERFAALMMVTKVVRAEESDEDMRRELLDAMGFRFLTRLMKTTHVPEGCPASIYKSIAFSILSSFSQDPSVVSDPEIQKQVTVLNEVVLGNFSDDEDDGTTMLSDCYECLRGMLLSPVSRQYLMEGGAQQALVEVVASKRTGHEKACEILLELLRRERSNVWKKNPGDARKLLRALVADFKLKQDASKFEIGDTLSVVLSTVEKMEEEEEEEGWVDDLVDEINNIIRSKLNDRLRDCMLGLASALIGSQGVMVLLPPFTYDLKLLLLLTHMACIEIRMVLEDGRLEQVQKKSGVVCACYGILENIIGHMTTGMSLGLNKKQVVQLHSAMMGAFNSVIFFLSQVDQQQITMDRSSLLVTASVRVLGAWLAEETSALRDETYKLLPFLVQVCRDHIMPDMDAVCGVSQLKISDSDNTNGEASSPVDTPPQTREGDGSQDKAVAGEAIDTSTDTSPTSVGTQKPGKHKKKNKKRKGNKKSDSPGDCNLKYSPDGTSNDPGNLDKDGSREQSEDVVKDASSNCDLVSSGKGVHEDGVAHNSNDSDKQDKDDSRKQTEMDTSTNCDSNTLEQENMTSTNCDSSSVSKDITTKSQDCEMTDAQVCNGDSSQSKETPTKSQTKSVSFNIDEAGKDSCKETCGKEDSSNPGALSDETEKDSSKDKCENDDASEKKDVTSDPPTLRKARSDVDLVKFLLPAMCHLTSEEKPREILLEENMPGLLVMYFQQQMALYLEHRELDLRDSLASLCGIFLNLAVTEPSYVSTNLSFKQLLDSLLTYLSLTAQDPNLLVLTANIVTLGLMFLRHQNNRTDISSERRDEFLAGCISFLSKAHSRVKRKPPMLAVSESYKTVWEDISELWYLSMQGMGALVPLYPDLPRLVMKSGWVPAIMRTLLEVQGAGVDSDSQSAIISLLTTLALNDTSAKRVIREKRGMELAEMYICEDLKSALTTS